MMCCCRLLLRFFLLAVAVDGFLPTRIFRTTGTTEPEPLYQAKHDSCDVAIYGGGFGGLYTALAISREAKMKGKKLDVALIEPSENFVFLPLLYDLTVGTATEAEVCPAYNDLLVGTGVRQIRASLDSFITADHLQSAILKPSLPSAPSELSFRAAVLAVGASPNSILRNVPGASEYTQPFYAEADAKNTRRLLSHLEDQVRLGKRPRIGVVGGGFAGVELAASIKRRIRTANVTLLTRGPPMAGTRAEPLINKALQKMEVEVEQCSVNMIVEADHHHSEGILQRPPVIVKRQKAGDNSTGLDSDPWDLVFWTAGSGPSYPVLGGLEQLRKSESGRLATDTTLRCFVIDTAEMTNTPGRIRTAKNVKMDQPPLWALGDCADIVSVANQPAVPKTAQAAMQQADTVAYNVLSQLETQNKRAPSRSFQYQDLGSMLTLGGPNAALMAPKEGLLAPVFVPALDVATEAFGFADKLIQTVSRSSNLGQSDLNPETLGLSLGSYGIGVDSGIAPGTLAGTLTGAARRAVYAARMPTNQQRAVAGVSAFISTAAALAREASSRSKKQ